MKTIRCSGISLAAKWKYQKLTRGYADYETWDLSSYAAEYIAPRLRHWIDSGVSGHPTEERLELEEGEDPGEAWDRILESIWWSMDQLAREEPDEPDLAGQREKFVEYHERINEGCLLLGKYFRDLWD